MSNPLDKSLEEMRNDSTKEVDDMIIEEEELEELEGFGARLAKAYELSGEPPSKAAIEYAKASVELPERPPEEYRSFNANVRRRIAESIQQEAGADSLGAWIRQARVGRSIDEVEAAGITGVSLPAYRLFEAGRMPIWRLPADKLAAFLHQLKVDALTVIRWASVTLQVTGAVYGRLDVDDDDRSELLDDLTATSGRELLREFNDWRQALIDASGEP